MSDAACVCVFQQYIEKLDLSDFISITDDNSWDHKVGVARLSLRLKDGEFNFTVSEYITKV